VQLAAIRVRSSQDDSKLSMQCVHAQLPYRSTAIASCSDTDAVKPQRFVEHWGDLEKTNRRWIADTVDCRADAEPCSDPAPSRLERLPGAPSVDPLAVDPIEPELKSQFEANRNARGAVVDPEPSTCGGNLTSTADRAQSDHRQQYAQSALLGFCDRAVRARINSDNASFGRQTQRSIRAARDGRLTPARAERQRYLHRNVVTVLLHAVTGDCHGVLKLGFDIFMMPNLVPSHRNPSRSPITAVTGPLGRP